MTASSRQDEDESAPCPTRRVVLLGAAGLAGLGGTLAACSTAAVPDDANEAGEAAQPSPAAAAASPAPAAMRTASTPADKPAARGVVLGAAQDIPVGGGMVFTTARVVVTQPARGQYRAFSAICTHVGCVVSQVASGTIDCPCHGSRFTITTGAVLAGPAPRPLPAKRIEVADGKVVLLS